MKTLFFDFETTGKMLKREPLDHPGQPRAVSVGLLLVADGTGTIGQAKFIIRPDGFTIPDEVVAVHGITNEIAVSCGVSAGLALMTLNHFAHAADVCVAFNADFDYKMAQIEAIKLNKPLHMPADKVKCSMMPYKDLMQMPGNYGDFKWPSLDEVCAWLRIPRDGAHDALGDVYTTMRVWYELRRHNIVP